MTVAGILLINSHIINLDICRTHRPHTFFVTISTSALFCHTFLLNIFLSHSCHPNFFSHILFVCHTIFVHTWFVTLSSFTLCLPQSPLPHFLSHSSHLRTVFCTPRLTMSFALSSLVHHFITLLSPCLWHSSLN